LLPLPLPPPLPLPKPSPDAKATATAIADAAEAEAYEQRVRESIAKAEANAAYRSGIVAAYDDEFADAHDALVETYPAAKKLRTTGTSAVKPDSDSKTAALSPLPRREGCQEAAKKTAEAKATSPIAVSQPRYRRPT